MHFGALGLFSVALLDSSVLPLPLPGSADFLLLWLVAHRGNPWLLAASGVAGSVLGGYTCWTSGRRGGEAALRRHASGRLLRRISAWVEKHSILAVFLPALLPPPIPLLPFLVTAGALGVPRKHYLLALGSARALRYGALAWISATYGRSAVRMWSSELSKWSKPLLWTFVVMLLGSIGFGIWKFRKQAREAKSSYPMDTHVIKGST